MTLSKILHFLRLSSFDRAYLVECKLARLKSAFFHARQFRSFGSASWLKQHNQIVNPGNIAIGANVRIERNATLYSVGDYLGKTHNGSICIGNAFFANRDLNISSARSITIGNSVTFGPNVSVFDFDHGYSDVRRNMLESELVIKGPVVIGDRCWLGANVFVASGVSLGQHCVVAANSVVTKSFPAYSVIAGNPARLIKRFDVQKNEWVRCAE